MRLDGSRSRSTLLVALLLVTFQMGCSRGSSTGAGSLETNRAYWSALSGGTLPSYALDALNVDGAATPSRAQLLKTRACGQLGIDALEAQNKRIAALPSKGVDAEILEYASALASTNAAKLAALSELRALPVDSQTPARTLSKPIEALRALGAKSAESELAL